MFDELYLSTLIHWAIAAALVGAALGFLPAGRLRLCLIAGWSLAPVWLLAALATLGQFSIGTLSFSFVFLMLVMPVWGLLTLLPFFIVRRVRNILAEG